MTKINLSYCKNDNDLWLIDKEITPNLFLKLGLLKFVDINKSLIAVFVHRYHRPTVKIPAPPLLTWIDFNLNMDN